MSVHCEASHVDHVVTVWRLCRKVDRHIWSAPMAEMWARGAVDLEGKAAGLPLWLGNPLLASGCR